LKRHLPLKDARLLSARVLGASSCGRKQVYRDGGRNTICCRKPVPVNAGPVISTTDLAQIETTIAPY
jgi:hypothetical protein